MNRPETHDEKIKREDNAGVFLSIVVIGVVLWTVLHYTKETTDENKKFANAYILERKCEHIGFAGEKGTTPVFKCPSGVYLKTQLTKEFVEQEFEKNPIKLGGSLNEGSI